MRSETMELDRADVLAGVDKLSNLARVRLPVVAALYDCHPATVWARVRRGEIPAPKKVGGSALWSIADLRKALAS
jgi:hypothetical protein